jgi:hypothetical protein
MTVSIQLRYDGPGQQIHEIPRSPSTYLVFVPVQPAGDSPAAG